MKMPVAGFSWHGYAQNLESGLPRSGRMPRIVRNHARWASASVVSWSAQNRAWNHDWNRGGGIVAAWRGESDWAVEWMLVCPSRGIWRCYRAMSWLDDANKPAAGVVPEPEHGLAATLRAVASALSHRMACRRRESPSQRRRQASSWSCNRDEPVTVGERPSHGLLTTAIIASASPAGQLMAGRLRLDSARTPPRL